MYNAVKLSSENINKAVCKSNVSKPENLHLTLILA